MIKNKLKFIKFIAERLKKRQVNQPLSSLINKISVFCLVICSAICIIVSSISKGFQKEVNSKLFLLFGDINISYQNSSENESEFEFWLKGQTQADFSLNKFISSMVLIEKNGKKTWSILHGCEIDVLRKIAFLNNSDISSESIILSKELADNTQNKAGDDINISSFGLVNFHIKGKIHSIIENCLGFKGQQFLITSNFLAKKIIKNTGFSIVSYAFYIKNKKKVDGIYLKMINELSSQFKIIKLTDHASETLNWINLVSNYGSVLISILIFLLNCLLVSITAVNIFSKHFSIRIFKILGLSRINILLIYLDYMFKKLIIYIFLGNILAFISLFLQKKFKIISLSPEIYLVNFIPVSFDWSFIFNINLSMIGTLLISFCFIVLITSKKIKIYDFLH